MTWKLVHDDGRDDRAPGGAQVTVY